MAITDWPRLERPREKLLHQTAQALSNAELIAVLLRTGKVGKTAVDLARDLLVEFGGLRGLLETDRYRLCQSSGIGTAKYVQFQAILEISRRYFGEILRDGCAMQTPEVVRQFLQSQLNHLNNEVFGCLFLDTQHRMIQFEILFRGTIDRSHVHPRVVLERALEYRSGAVIFAHNHPSGDPTPSDADKQITQLLTKALNLVNIQVLDHFIIAKGRFSCFSEQGLM